MNNTKNIKTIQKHPTSMFSKPQKNNHLNVRKTYVNSYIHFQNISNAKLSTSVRDERLWQIVEIPFI